MQQSGISQNNIYRKTGQYATKPQTVKTKNAFDKQTSCRRDRVIYNVNKVVARNWGRIIQDELW